MHFPLQVMSRGDAPVPLFNIESKGAYNTDLPVLLKAFDTLCRLSYTDFIRVDVSLILYHNAWNASFCSNISMASCFNKRLLFRSPS